MHAPAWAGHVVASRYRLQDAIGHGTLGTVWRARDELLGRDVAVKEVLIPPAPSAADRSARYQRTMREAKTAARLNHASVVTVFDVVEEGGRPWIIMELMHARSLDQVLAEEGPLPPARVAGIGQQLASALAAAHAAGVLHRDVKPGNVLLCPDGRAVLTDFGIGPGDTPPAVLAWAAPERIRGAPATPSSDLWALGATLYAAVQGRGGAIIPMSTEIDEDRPAVSPAGPLGPVIAALMRKDPAARPDAAAAARLLSEALGGASGGRPSPADIPRPASPWPANGPGPASPWPAGAPGPGDEPAAPLLGPGGLFHGAAVAGTGRYLPAASGQPIQARAGEAAAPARRGRRLAMAACAVVIVAAGVTGGLTVAHSLRATPVAGHRTVQGTSHPASPASATPRTGGSAPAAAPAGYDWYSLPAASAGTAAGFRLAVPQGWSASNSGLVTYLRNPAGPGFMEVDLTRHTFAGEMAEARWLQRQTLRQGKFPGYRRISLRPVTVLGSAGALWAFSWEEDGVGRVVAQDYLFSLPAAAGSQSYALYASAPAAAWPQIEQALDEALRTFQPLT